MSQSLFSACPESNLEMLTDVTHEYFLNITKALRHAVDREAFTGKTGFPVGIIEPL
jgi:hypothetical protein